MIRIAACIRTYNEENNIAACCNAYSFADILLIADGGSTDATIAIANSYSNVKVRNYPVKVECANGIWRNPDGPHIQFLIDWAAEEKVDWIIVQDCDQRPNKFLKQDARKIFETSNKDFIMATQIYLWGKDKYFHDLTFMGGDWQQGLWAWRAIIGMKIIDKMPHFEFSYDGKTSFDLAKSDRTQYIKPPYCYMHFGWPTPERTMEHIEYYRKSGLIAGMLSPLQFGGKPVPLLDWMTE